MSAPLLWVFPPLVISLLMLLFLDSPRWVKWTGVLGMALLAGLTWLLPVGQPITFLGREFQIEAAFFFLGRRLTILDRERPLLMLLFLTYGCWFMAVDTRRVSIRVVPLGMMGLSLNLAVLGVEPILYAAVLFAFLALVYTLLLSPPPDPVTPGVLRFLVYQVLGMLLMLFAAWMFSWVDHNAVDR